MPVDILYVPIDKWLVRENTVQSCDIFFRSPEGKMTMCCAGGEKGAHEFYEKLLDPQTEPLFINRKDKNKFRFYVEDNLGGILSDSRIESRRRAEAAYRSIHFIAEQLFKHPKAEAIRRYRKTISNTVEFVLREKPALLHLIGLTTFDFSIFNHSINVGIFSTGLSVEILGNTPEHNLNEVVAGFFLHDIGKCRTPPDILYKRGPLSRGEWRCMQNHVNDGLEILADHSMLSKESEIIVGQHHERHDGSGYPRGLRGDRIHMYGRICSIADVFDGLTSYRPYRLEYSSFEALRIMKSAMFKDFDPSYFATFVNLFGNKMNPGVSG
jgi:HD-GYP domain-containing protein (c-di-GMP phosphodiesterase class II)